MIHIHSHPKPAPHEPTVEETTQHVHAGEVARHVAMPMAGALSGAAVGAIIGTVAGLPGIVAGGLFGGVIGAASLHWLDVGDMRASRRDQKLDDEIGVTSRNLGAAPVSVRPKPVDEWETPNWPNERK